MHNLNLDVTMKVNKSNLFVAILYQREEHAKNYKEAQEGWRNSMITVAQQIIEKGARLKKFPMSLRRINCPPECHIQDFDDALSMIKMTTEDVINLSSSDYEQLVLGRWDWKREWGLSNSKYMTGATGSTGSGGVTGSTVSGGITDDELE